MSQQRIWILLQLEPENSAVYNTPWNVHAEGHFSSVALTQGVWEIKRRHEALRTSFEQEDGQSWTIVHNGEKDGLGANLVDLTGIREREKLGARLIQLEAQRPFDLSGGSLMRTQTMRMSTDSHELVFNTHHLASDGWSTGIVIQETVQLYGAFQEGRPSPLPELKVQYPDYAVWQKRILRTEAYSEQLTYWREQLKGAPPLLELPTDRPRPAAMSYRGAWVQSAVTGEHLERLRALGHREHTTLFMAYSMVLGALLMRYSGANDVCIGTPIAGRKERELEGLVGFFLNTLVLRIRLDGNPRCLDLLQQVRDSALDAYANEKIPFEAVVEELQPTRNLSYSPLFQVMLAPQQRPAGVIDLGSLQLNLVGAQSSESSKYDLLIYTLETSEGLVCTWEYNTDLFDASTIQRMAEQWGHLLRAVAARPEERVYAIGLFGEAEIAQLVFEWNDTEGGSAEKSIYELVAEQASRIPDAVALVSDVEQLTYSELQDRAAQLGDLLQKLGVSAEAPVGVCLSRSPEMIIGLLGVLHAGGVYLPLDPTYPQERLGFMLSDAQMSVLLTQTEQLQSLPPSDATLICLDGVAWQSPPQQPTPRDVSVDNLAYFIYTSGSTGRPKGVSICHGSAAALIKWAAGVFGPETLSGVLTSTSICFDLSVYEIFATLSLGGRIILAEDALQLPFLPARDAITLVNTVPSAMAELADGELLPANVRTVNLAGELLPTSLVDKIYETKTVELVYDLYGPSEDTTYSTYTRRLPGAAPSIGVPITNTRAHLLDGSENNTLLSVPGELFLDGAGLARGYLGRPNLTAERFVASHRAAMPGDRTYRTGDLARFASDGTLAVLGRLDHQVKIRGFRIEIGEIETQLRAFAEVRECVVLARQEDSGQKRLVAYVVVEPTETISVEALRSRLAAKLPDYMIPAAFVFLNAMPLTPNGKVDRKALPAPDTRPELASQYVGPRNPHEEALCAIWSELLKIDKIGVHDNFFSLGGDSILSIQMVSRASRMGIRFTPKDVFANQTVATLAAVAKHERGPEVTAEQGLIIGDAPLTPVQEWFFAQESVAPDHFNQALLLRSPGMNGEVLGRTIDALVHHHDALRGRFVRTSTGWQQSFAPKEGRQLFGEVDLSVLSPEQQKTFVEHIANWTQIGLNLADGPLLSFVQIILGGEQGSRLLGVIHHLVVDGVSWRILLEDLQLASAQQTSGIPMVLPTKTTSFQQWAKELAEYAQSPGLNAEIPSWLERALSVQADLPRDFPDGTNSVESTEILSVTLSNEETELLLRQVPEAYNTQVNDVLLTALADALCAWTGRNEVLVDLEGHGRVEEVCPDVDLSRTVGWFTDIYPVTLDIGGIPNPGDRLKSVKEQLRSIPRGGIDFGVLRYSGNAQMQTSLAKLPPREVVFNYLGQFDQSVGSEPTLSLATESTGMLANPRNSRRYLLEINGSIVNGELSFRFGYGRQVHRRESIQQVADAFLAALRSLITHCVSEEAEGFTPSDFADAGISQDELDSLADAVAFEDSIW